MDLPDRVTRDGWNGGLPLIAVPRVVQARRLRLPLIEDLRRNLGARVLACEAHKTLSTPDAFDIVKSKTCLSDDRANLSTFPWQDGHAVRASGDVRS